MYFSLHSTLKLSQGTINEDNIHISNQLKHYNKAGKVIKKKKFVEINPHEKDLPTMDASEKTNISMSNIWRGVKWGVEKMQETVFAIQER